MASGVQGKKNLSPDKCEFPGCKGVPGYPKLVQRHRIIPGRNGGRYRKGNVISLCPNHHILADKGYLEATFLSELVRLRLEKEYFERETQTSLESTGGSRPPEKSGRNTTQKPIKSDGECATNGANGFFSRIFKR